MVTLKKLRNVIPGDTPVTVKNMNGEEVVDYTILEELPLKIIDRKIISLAPAYDDGGGGEGKLLIIIDCQGLIFENYDEIKFTFDNVGVKNAN